ncbi:phosphate/phosphite/phosphonate ABC transporter substrate-binding protein [Ahrensia sp. R2A130]|uniref:phosphate/phosphite/phosphonate ABC transporter substrate-binding protein n=1 Tax=Ahrensia sp. R2A130 TaxID=744979 RepID=UPI0001E0ACDF|nr:PhnD/SsuA/transferrin family substrate-binding protein [Ahrensia sp. R2A130]EFL88464.1 putative ABC phosphate/phosphonate transporter, periplasmic ligand binding protein [Ahrensia sp. R2A130]
MEHSSPVASLPMYDFPELREAHDRFWVAIRDNIHAEGVNAPDSLSLGGETMSHWTDAALILSQTCGLPYARDLHGKVQLVGTPDYGVESCPPGYYHSAIVIRADDERETFADFASARFAVNSTGSQSGYKALTKALENIGSSLRIPQITGSHENSALAVAEGREDVAAIDAVTFQHLCRYRSWTEKLRILTHTPPTPGLPYICSLDAPRTTILNAVRQSIDALSIDDREALLIRGMVDIPASRYAAVL